MSQNLSADQELVSDVVACQLVIKQILDVLDVIAPGGTSLKVLQ